jgi:hypothetical protein
MSLASRKQGNTFSTIATIRKHEIYRMQKRKQIYDLKLQKKAVKICDC